MAEQYEKYKDSGIEWIGDIPNHWTITKVKFLADPKSDFSFIDGDWVESKYITGEGIRLIQTGNVGVGRFKDQGSKYITEETFQELNCKEVYSGDILISRLSPPVARACLAPDLPTKMITSVDNVILRPKESIDSRFIVYFFSTRNYLEYVDILARGATMSRISRTILSNNPVILPTYEEQTAIANYLDEKTSQIDRLIDIAQKKIERLQEYRTALINQVVTKGLEPNVPMKESGIEWIGKIPNHWGITKLKYVSEISPSKTKNIKENEKITFLPMENVGQNGEINQTKSYEFSNVKSGFTYFEKDDVILAKITPCFENGKGALLTNLKTEYGFGSSEFHVLRAKDNVLPEWLYYITKDEVFRKVGKDFMTGAAGQKRVPKTFLENWLTPVPPINEQKWLIEVLKGKLNYLNEMLSREQQRIHKLQEYRQTLISEIVTGKKKVVKNEAYVPA